MAGIKPIYDIKSPLESSRMSLSDAGSTMGKMSQGSSTTTEPPGKTAGGAMMNTMGGAATGAMIGSVVPGIGTAIGAVGGAVIGLASYYLS